MNVSLRCAATIVCMAAVWGGWNAVGQEAANGASARAPDPRDLPGLPIGSRVVFKFQGSKLKEGNAIVPGQKFIQTYEVIDTNSTFPGGPWVYLKVVGKGLKGWTTAAEVVPKVDAISFFTEQIRANPNDAWNWQMRGHVWYEEKKEYDIAIKDLSEALRLSPSAAMYNSRGYAWGAKKDYDKAIADYNEAIRLDPEFALAYNNRGIAWWAKKDYDKAIADYNEAIRLDPEFAWVYYNRGYAWWAKKDYGKAIADYNEAIRLDPEFALAYYNRGYAWETKKDYDKAIADYNEAIRLDPGSEWPHYGRAILNFIQGAYAEAANGFRETGALESAKGEMAIYACIMEVLSLERAGRSDEAASRLKERAPQLDASLWPYPIVAFLAGQLEETALLAKSTDGDKMTETRCYLGLLALARGQTDTARGHWEWVKQNGTTSFTEYDLSLAELERLDAAKP